jgi:hypothetical protein
VPDGAEGGLDDGRLADGGGCGDAGVGHDCGCVCVCVWDYEVVSRS